MPSDAALRKVIGEQCLTLLRSFRKQVNRRTNRARTRCNYLAEDTSAPIGRITSFSAKMRLSPKGNLKPICTITVLQPDAPD